MLAVRHRRVRCPRRRLVSALVRLTRRDSSTPCYLTGRPIDREHGELIVEQRIHIIVSPFRHHAVEWFLQPLLLGSRDKHQVAPHHRRGVPKTWQPGLPTNVIFFAPLDRWIGLGRYPGGLRPSPLPPLNRRIGRLARRWKKKAKSKEKLSSLCNRDRHWGVLQNVATGFSGEPVAPSTGSGLAVSRNE